MSGAFTVIIPARLASTRLPGKPLREIAGVPMILHVVERARRSGASAVWVATDDRTVQATCEAAGAQVVMTRSDHESGSDRLAEACEVLAIRDEDIVVNVQGDEPLIPPAIIGQVAALLRDSPAAQMASLYHPMTDAGEVADPNAVKVVCNGSDEALYFSRAPIPWDRQGGVAQRAPGNWKRHIGLYAYRAGFLRAFVSWLPAPTERLEALEQLRALHHGATIKMAAAVEQAGPGVDTEADLNRVRALIDAADDDAGDGG